MSVPRAPHSPLRYERLSELISARMGLQFPPERWADLERGLAGAARDFQLPDAAALADELLDGRLTRERIETLASHLTVGETYFFREPQSFEALERHILPPLLAARARGDRRLRIWSAACCTGEEPYSIAMLLHRLIPDLENWRITLLATDINPEFLRKATEGVYGEWSFRAMPDAQRQACFTRRPDGRYEIKPRIRRMVSFGYLNLVDDTYPSLLNNTSAMDIVFCRNVLMYFAPEQARKVADALHRTLLDGGWLFVSPAEAGPVFSAYASVQLEDLTVYRKRDPAQTQPAAPAPAAVIPPPPPVTAPKPAAARPAPKPVAAPREPRPEAPALHQTAREHADQGRLDEALACCERAIAADKLDPAHRYLLATVLQEQGQPDAAARALERALYLDPDFVLAHFTLATVRLSQRRFPEARRHLDNARALLARQPPDAVLPQSDGLTAGRLAEIVAAARASLPAAARAGREGIS